MSCMVTSEAFSKKKRKKKAASHRFLPSSWAWFYLLWQAFLRSCSNPELVAWIRLFPKTQSVSSNLSTPCLWWRFLPWPCPAGCTSCSPNPGISFASAGTTCLSLVSYFSQHNILSLDRKMFRDDCSGTLKLKVITETTSRLQSPKKHSVKYYIKCTSKN